MQETKSDVRDSLSVLPQAHALGAGIAQNYIGGRWVSTKGGVWQHIHPATGEEDFTVAVASEPDVDRAVRAARKAFDEGQWPRMRARERQLMLRPIADLLRRNADRMHRLQTLDNGLPIRVGSVGRFSASFAADIFDYQIGWIDKLDGVAPPPFSDEGGANQTFTVKEPIGVVAAITPFNAPILQFAVKVATALAAGCTIVVKPSEYASNVAAFYTQLLEQLNLPAGVFNLVTGPAITSAALLRHPLVDKIVFTGRHAVGQSILSEAAKSMKRVQLELGGKSPSIVFPDVPNVHEAGRYAMSLVSMGLSGQVCSTQTRAIVHHSIYEAFVEGAQSQISRVVQGSPFDPETTSAPLINSQAADRVMYLIEEARSSKARLVAGGGRVEGAGNGNWVEPTLFADVDNEMTIAREEVFGPVLCVIPFKDEDEAIGIANDTQYGLSAGVYTGDVSRALRVARSIRAGTVGINQLYVNSPVTPFGGYKSSGLGREGGREGIEEYLETKTISIPLNS